jgi:murein DD-endopeptidase MepM/ murein hydrolase activator NlpD
MPKPYRILSLGLFASFGASLVGLLVTEPAPVMEAALPAVLPAAHANPAEVGFQDTLQRGETLSQLLLRTQLAEQEARAVLVELQQHQDPRRLRPGSVISYRKSFVDGSVRGMEVSLDADRTLNLQKAGEAWTGLVEEVPVYVDTVVLAGSVESSLYSALLRAEGVDMPAEERRQIVDILADRVFAWQIDFSRDLRPGDRYRILYERLVRPDGTARTGRVAGVQLSINAREFEAYAFRTPDGFEDYYDRDGESLRRAFLRAPLEFRRISSAFSKSRFHPVLQVNRPHNGIDYAASTGTPVRAVGDGVVRRAGWGGGYGNVVDIAHRQGYSSRYAHLNGFASGVRAGTRVRQGDVIGYVGSTGLSTAPHLHYEFHANGRPVDPNSIRYITGEPLARRHRPEFARAVAAQVAVMNRVSEPVLLADAARRGAERVATN